MKRSLAIAVAVALVLTACGGRHAAPPPATAPPPALDAASIEARCDRVEPFAVLGDRAISDAGGARAFDVAFYTAHPDDEAMYAGGTLVALAARGVRTSLTVNSHGEGGRLLVDGVERRDFSTAEVTRVRDAEMAEAARREGTTLFYLHEAAQDVDYGFTTSCKEALAHWDATLPGGLRALVETIEADLRRKRPRVVVTLDPRDDPQASHHGHHKAVGVLVELAARAVAGEAGIEELVTMAPADAPPETVATFPVDARARRHALEAHASQFWPKDLDGFGMRPDERFVVRWRTGAAGGRAVLAGMMALPAR